MGLSLLLPGLLVVIAWLTLAPVRLGGAVTYVITSGTSMEPRFHSGDLVAVRQGGSYQVGDIIAYHMTQNTIVLHRIVDRDSDRFVMQGDNNSWRDSSKPQVSQVVGKLWLHAPGFGRVMTVLRAPLLAASLAFVVGFGLTMGRPSRQRHRRDTAVSERVAPTRAAAPLRREDLVGIAIGFLLLSIGLAALSFSRPTERQGAVHVDYRQSGNFGYSAFAAGGVYADNQVTPGDPIYLRLVRDLDLRFDYQFSSHATHALRGSSRLTAEIAQGTGWRRTIELAPETPFEGDQVSATGRLSLINLQIMTAAFAAQTGFKGDDYTLTVLPEVRVEGNLAGGALQETYAPRVSFRMDSLQLALQDTGAKNNALRPVELGVADRLRSETNSFSLLGVQITVARGRIVTVSASMLAAIAVLILRWAMLANRSTDEATRIQTRYRSVILNIQNDAVSLATREHTVDLLSIEDLVRAADQHGRMILHLSTNVAHQYLVEDGALVYRYSVPHDIIPIAAGRRRKVSTGA